ncbi:MAG: hypothetical protein M3Z25_11015 [Actinomycetota bacterium]|nr:hypothetical protein [Actinomycetota bacterium]
MVEALTSGNAQARRRSWPAGLLHTGLAGAARSLDAIVVAAARPAHHLSHAAMLASEFSTPLVALCSQEAYAPNLFELTTDAVAAVDLPADYSHPLLDLDTCRPAQPAARRLGDLSTKRNLGLLLARLVGWRTVLFLDDDIHVRPAAIRRAARHLAGAAAVGLGITEFPDHSVLGHARRLVGQPHEVFLGGSALLVDVERMTSFFPSVYNEDWLFLMDGIWAGQVARVGTARQLPYDPFSDPLRAEDEEFGDLLAEGLMWITHGAPRNPAAVLSWASEPACWRELRAARLAELDEVASQADARADVLAALMAARSRATAIGAAELAAWVRTWRVDVERWRERIEQLPSVGSLASAFRELGVVGHSRVSNM